MRNPAFSFVVPVYGTEQYLRRCIDSVLGQSSADWELIVVDDASPGGCEEIVGTYGDLRIRYVRHEKNRSLLQARITGVRAASGEYIVPLDSDDYVHDGLVEALQKASSDSPDVIFYHMQLGEGTKLSPAWHNAPAGACSCSDVLKRLFRQELSWCLCGKAFRRSLYLEAVDSLACGADCYINSTEDLCQMVPMLMLGRVARFINYRGYVYFNNAASMSKSWMTPDALAMSSKQNQKSISLCVDFARRLNADAKIVTSIQDLDQVTIEWLLSLADNASMSLWGLNANIIARAYGLDRLLKALIRKYPNFLVRYAPSQDVVLYVKPRSSSVRRIGVICDRGFGGGAEKVTKAWAFNMISTGREIVWLCAPEYETEMRDVVGRPGLQVIALKNAYGMPRYVELEDLCRRFELDAMLFVDHWKVQTLYDLVWIKSLGVRTVAAEHSAFFFPLDDCDIELFNSRINAYRLADAVTVLSNLNLAWWKASGIGNAVYMPNYLPFNLKSVKRIDAEDRFGKRNLLYVGRICERKGAKQAIESFKMLMGSDFPGKPECRLVFLGRFDDEAYRKSLQQEVRDMALADRVVFAGEVKNVQEYLEDAFLLLNCSRIEGSPVTFFEAKAYGIPIVAYSLPFVEGMDESSGVLTVPQGDVCAMAEAVRACMVDKSKYCKLSSAATASLEGFSDDKITDLWNRLWGDIERGGCVGGEAYETNDSILPTTMDSAHAALRPLLSASFSAGMSTETLSQEAAQLYRKTIRKLKNKVAEFGVAGALRRIAFKLPALAKLLHST